MLLTWHAMLTWHSFTAGDLKYETYSPSHSVDYTKCGFLLIQGKRDPQAADPPIDTSKNPNFLVLISENFIEACAAFNRTGMESSALNQSLVEMDMSSVAPVSAPAATFNPAGSGKIWNSLLYTCVV